MGRLFSVPRRRPNLVDVYIPFTYGVDIYRLKWGANFDTSPMTAFIDSTNVGFIDYNIPSGKVESQPTAGRQVRIVFDPATYHIPDDKPFWLRFVPVTGGMEGTPSAPTLIMTEEMHHGVGVVTIQGTAPNGASVADSLEIDLPRNMSDIRIHNREGGGTLLYVATEPGGSETIFKNDTGPITLSLNATQNILLVRGGAATASFSAVFTLSFPK